MSRIFQTATRGDVTSSYEERLAQGNHSILYITRLRYMATEFYNCINSLNPAYPHKHSYHYKHRICSKKSQTSTIA